jgi:hypothetical protein
VSKKHFGAMTLMMGFVLAGLLAGCANSVQPIVDQTKACMASVYNSPDFAPLRPHIPLDARDISLAQLSDPSHATKPEIDALQLTHPGVQACEKIALDGLARTMPSLVPALAKNYSINDDDLVLVTQQKLSWGEQERHRRDLFLAFQAIAVAEGQRVDAQNLQRADQALNGMIAGLSIIQQNMQARTDALNASVRQPVPTYYRGPYTCSPQGGGTYSCQ